MTAAVTLPRPTAELVRDVLASKGLRIDALDAAMAEPVPWHKATGLLEQMRGYLARMDQGDGGLVGAADQTAAAVVEYFDAVGVDLRDERTLFAVLATIAFLSQAADKAARIGTIDPDGHRATLVVLRSAGVCLSVLAPSTEAR